MAHDHHHHGDDTYFIDQLCMVGLSGAFGVICLCLYFFQRAMLNLLLGPQFHLFVVISGFTLLTLALVRAATLWRESRPTTAIASLPVVTAPHSHDDDHHHEHDHHHHEHHHHHHDHSHTHEHGHDHHHGGHHHHHDHAHDHSHDDHSHGWAPWRYVIMLVPIMLFMLGLPNKGPKAADHNDDESRTAELIREASQAATLVGLEDWSRLVRLGKIAGDDSLGDVTPISFKTLMDSIDDPHQRAFWQNKTVSIRGQFVASTSDPRFFSLVRFSIQCCAGDAVDKRVNVVSREPITHIKRDAWAEVIGKVEYGKRGNASVVRLVTTGAAKVQACAPDPDPYIK